MTINVLPDNVLLETFDFYLGEDNPNQFDDGHDYDGWQTLVHVCRRWRCIVFASPRRLDLKLYCTQQRSVYSKTLDIWPALPIVIFSEYIQTKEYMQSMKSTQSKEDVADIVAALGHHNRVCKIHYDNHEFQDSLLKEVAAIDKPFLVLTSVRLGTFQRQNVPVLPNSFLGGSAPRLRSLDLYGVPYPSMGRLLSSTTNLVGLFLRCIPHSGYIAPETIVPLLSTLSRLESLKLGFEHPRSQAPRVIRHLPPRVVFPNLAYLGFAGNVEYLEDVLSQIETPILNQSDFYFFNQLVFDAPLLGHFIHRTETFMTIHTASVGFYSTGVVVTLFGPE